MVDRATPVIAAPTILLLPRSGWRVASQPAAFSTRVRYSVRVRLVLLLLAAATLLAAAGSLIYHYVLFLEPLLLRILV